MKNLAWPSSCPIIISEIQKKSFKEGLQRSPSNVFQVRTVPTQSPDSPFPGPFPITHITFPESARKSWPLTLVILRTALSTQMVLSLDIPRGSSERSPECRGGCCLPHWWYMWSLNYEGSWKGAIHSQDSPNPSTHHHPGWCLNGGRNEGFCT